MSVVRAALVAASATLLITGCSADSGSAGADPAGASASDMGSSVVIGGDELPEAWPDALPSFPGGVLVSAAVSEGGTEINAVWHSADPLALTWDRMDATLREAGFVPTGETGGPDASIADDTMIVDVYTGAGFEVSASALAGDPVTVLLNASAN